jgi:phospholipid-binding lipoprotein MlaA
MSTQATATGEAPANASTPPVEATGADTVPPADDAAQPPASTAAESDFDALYGAAPDADGAPAAPVGAYDPWEPYNRRMHGFNNAVDRHVAKPLAKAYVKVVPRPVRSGVSNFFSNLGQPASAVNALLQGRPKQAAHSLGRFVMNSTLGIGGIFDPATDARLDNRNEDFGQTLGVWGWKRSRYVELPLFGPRTLRDVLGMAGDAPLSPMRQVQADRIRVPLQGLQLVDLRMQLMSTDALREGAEDDYRLVRDAWMQRRAYQIDGDRADDDDIPDYLKEDPNMVPVGAMPVSGD